MSRVKQTALALSVLFSLEFLFLGLFPNGTFAWTNQSVLPPLKAASHTDAGVVKLDSPARTDGASVLESYGEVTPALRRFFSRNRNRGSLPPELHRRSAFFQVHSSSQSVSLSFQICAHSLILPRSRSKRPFTPAMTKTSPVVVLDYFSLRRLSYEYSSKDSCSRRFFRGFC